MKDEKLYTIKWISPSDRRSNLYKGTNKYSKKMARYIRAEDNQINRGTNLPKSGSSAYSERAVFHKESFAEIIADTVEEIDTYLELITSKGIPFTIVEMPERFKTLW